MSRSLSLVAHCRETRTFLFCSEHDRPNGPLNDSFRRHRRRIDRNRTIYDPHRCKGRTRRHFDQLFPSPRITRTESSGRERQVGYRGGKRFEIALAPRLITSPALYRLLKELNPSVVGKADERSAKQVLVDDPEWFRSFSLVIVCGSGNNEDVGAQVERDLSTVLWEGELPSAGQPDGRCSEHEADVKALCVTLGGQVETPMISLRTSGFVAKIRTQFREHCGESSMFESRDSFVTYSKRTIWTGHSVRHPPRPFAHASDRHAF